MKHGNLQNHAPPPMGRGWYRKSTTGTSFMTRIQPSGQSWLQPDEDAEEKSSLRGNADEEDGLSEKDLKNPVLRAHLENKGSSLAR